MPKHYIVLTENDIAKIINGEEIHIEFKQPIKVGEKIIVRQMSEKSTLRQIYDLMLETYPTATNIIIEVWPEGAKIDVTTREYEFIQQEKTGR